MKLLQTLLGCKARVLSAVGVAGLVLAVFASTAAAGLTKPSVSFSPSPYPSSVSQVSPVSTSYPDALAGLGSGFGDVTAPVGPVNFSSTSSGCFASDFSGFTPGDIALINRGYCTFASKVTNAIAAGAVAVIIANNIPGAGPVDLGFVAGSPVTVPVVFVSYEDGQSLASATAAHVTVSPYANSMTMSFTVNRGPKAISSISCTFDSVALASCGTQTSTKNSTTYTLPLTFGAGTHTFTVSFVTTDGGSDTESFTFMATG